MKHTMNSRLHSILRIAAALSREDDGQDLIEYSLVAALVGLAAVASMRTLGDKINNTFSSLGSQLTSAI